jgi:hypothetical protein
MALDAGRCVGPRGPRFEGLAGVAAGAAGATVAEEAAELGVDDLVVFVADSGADRAAALGTAEEFVAPVFTGFVYCITTEQNRQSLSTLVFEFILPQRACVRTDVANGH